MSEEVSRRNIFHILGAVPAAAALGSAATAHEGHSHAAAETPAAKGPYKRKTFDDRQWQAVRVLSDLIIPADDSGPAASAAGVPEYLDDWIAFRTEQDGNQNFQAEILGGLMWLDRECNKACGKNFVDADETIHKQLLDRVAYDKKVAKNDSQGAKFFRDFRNLVVGGYFSSKPGVKALPYLGNVAVAKWTGCDPKVWSIIEDRMKNGYKDGVVEAKPWGTKSS
jgi:gluconate 2-dehydrogenase gamma chain